MCHALFLGSSKPMELVSVADVIWFGVEELAPRHESIRRHFPESWHVYFVNSHDGCGCGFHSDANFPDENAEYDHESRYHLAEYLRHALRNPSIALALYDCWEGEEEEPFQSRTEATPEEIENRLDPAPDGTFVLIRRSA